MKAGFIIGQLRRADGATQASVASRLGVSRTYLSQVERGKVQPGLKLLRDAANIFQVPLPLFFVFEGDEDSPVIHSLYGILTDLLNAKRAATARQRLVQGQL